MLVCHEGTDTLHPSSVTMDDGTPVNSLAPGTLTGAQQAALCDLGGASFGNIPGHTEHDLTVDLDDPGH